MKAQMAEATAEKLREDERVEEATVEENYQGAYVEATPTDRVAAESLQSDLHEYPVWIEVLDP